MSAPDTNTETQHSAHKTPLAGIAIGVGVAVALLIALMVWLAYNGNEPRDASDGAAAVQIETPTGGSLTITGTASD